MALSDIQTLVDNFVRDASATVSTSDRDAAIDLAVRRLSEDRPQPAVEDVVSDGSHLLPLPASWEDFFSVIDTLEYPIGYTPPSLIDQAQWSMYRDTVGLKIQTLYSVNAGESVRVSFSIPHVVDATHDTTLIGQREALAAYAAAILLDQLASSHSADEDPTIQADAVNHRDIGKSYAARAVALRKLYYQRLGIQENKVQAAGAVVNLNEEDSRGRDRLTHSRRYR